MEKGKRYIDSVWGLRWVCIEQIEPGNWKMQLDKKGGCTIATKGCRFSFKEVAYEGI